MDIRCPKCAEPWELDSLHEEVSARWPDEPWKVNGTHDQTKYETYYNQVRQEFYAKGCEAMSAGFGAHCNPSTKGSEAAAITSALMDLAGDDVDGLASDLDDLDHLGLL